MHRGSRRLGGAGVCTDRARRQRVVRMVYEVCTFQALREQLRCKEIWVVGADRWRNPAQDLPMTSRTAASNTTRALRKPLDPTEFIDASARGDARRTGCLDAALPELDWLEISRTRAGPDQADPAAAAAEPRNLRRLKSEVHPAVGCGAADRHPQGDGAAHRLPRAVTSVADRGSLPEVLAERLLLAIYGYGTNTGIRAVVAGGARAQRGRHPVCAAPLPDPRGGPAHRVRASRTPPSPPATPACGATPRPPSPRIPRISARSIRTSSPSATPATAAAVC